MRRRKFANIVQIDIDPEEPQEKTTKRIKPNVETQEAYTALAKCVETSAKAMEIECCSDKQD